MKVTVAGGKGMIGRNVAKLLELSHEVLIADLACSTDLRNPSQCFAVTFGADRVFHLADRTMGVGYSSTHHGEMMTNSLLVSLNLLESARHNHVQDYLYVSSSCVYPGGMNVAATEENADFGTPEAANEGYGWAKRIGEMQARYYAKEYGMRVIIARPANVFGPSYDWNNPEAHVIPSLIRKMLKQEPEIVVWGDGLQTRTFQHEKNTAMMLVALMNQGVSGEAYNLGGYEISIRDLVKLLADLCQYEGRIVYDATAVQGPSRKAQNTSKITDRIGFTPTRLGERGVSFSDGLKETVEAARKIYCKG
jgi:GDP-L-fucose synthase